MPGALEQSLQWDQRVPLQALQRLSTRVDGSLERSCQFVQKGYPANGSLQRLLRFITKMEERWYRIIRPEVSVINSGIRD